MSDWRAAEVFEAVVRQGGLARAARGLGVSTAYVSRQLAAFERRLGARLVVRTTRTLRLTPAGEVAFAQASSLAGGVAHLREAVADLQAAPQGPIRLTTAAGYAQHRLARPLAAFAALYPAVTLDLVLTDAVLDLERDRIDLAIRFGALPDSDHLRRPLPAGRVFLCASPDYLRRHPAPVSLEDLEAHRCIVSPEVSWRFHFDGQEHKLTPRAAIIATSVAAIAALARAGAGIAYLPDFEVDDAVAAGRLIPLLRHLTPADIPVAMLYRPAPSRRLANLIAHLTRYDAL